MSTSSLRDVQLNARALSPGEARAAAFVVYLHTGPTAWAAPLLAQKLQAPLSLERSVHEVARAADTQRNPLKRQLTAALMRAAGKHAHSQHPYQRACCSLLGQKNHAHVLEQEARKRPEVARKLLAAADDACQVDHHDADITFDPHTFITKAVVSAQVKRPVSDFAKQSDPRNWAAVAPIAFQQSYQVQLDGAGLPLEAADGRYLELRPSEPGAAPLGSSWSGKMFEDVVFAWDELQLSEFRNLLNITFQVQPKRVEMRFSLYRAVSCAVALRELPGGLDVDDGYFEATPVEDREGWTQIRGEKRVRFRDLTPSDSPYLEPATSGQYLNYMAPSLVGIFMDEFIYNGACFGLEPEKD